jgi:hypothetical protein
MKKITTIALTGALALGALGIGSMSDLPIPGMKAEQASAAVMADIQSYGSTYMSPSTNVLRVEPWIELTFPYNDDFYVKHKPSFNIKNSVGTVVKSGGLNQWVVATSGQEAVESLTNISLSTLPAGHYRVSFSIPLDDRTLTSADNVFLTQHFYKDAGGNLSQFSQ